MLPPAPCMRVKSTDHSDHSFRHHSFIPVKVVPERRYLVIGLVILHLRGKYGVRAHQQYVLRIPV